MVRTPASQSEIDRLIDVLPNTMKPVMRLSFQEQRLISDKVSAIANVVMGCEDLKVKGLVNLMEEHDKKAMDWREKHEIEGAEWRRKQTKAMEHVNNIVLGCFGGALAINFTLGVLWAIGWLKIPHP